MSIGAETKFSMIVLSEGSAYSDWNDLLTNHVRNIARELVYECIET